MFEQVINNYYFKNLIYILFVVLLSFSIINELKIKNMIEIKKCLDIKKINIKLFLKYLFLSFIVRIILEQLVIFIHVTTTDIQIPSNILEVIIDFIVSGIFAPIFEEIIFRFGLYKKLNGKFSSYISILITSIVFATIHFYKIDGFIILIGISIVWNYLFYKTDNLIYPILLHFFYNVYALSDNLLNYSNYWYILLLIDIFGFIIFISKKQNK